MDEKARWGNPHRMDFAAVRGCRGRGASSTAIGTWPTSCRTDVVGYPLFDATTSGFNQGSKNWRGLDRNRYRITGMLYGDNFGTILVDWGAIDVRVTLQFRDVDGDVLVSHPFHLTELTAKPKANAAAPAEPKPTGPLPEGVLTPAQVLKMVDKEVTVQFAPVGGRMIGQAEKRRLLLNSEREFRSDANLTVMLTGGAFTGPFKDATVDTFKDKSIRVKGTIKLFQNRPEIEVTDPKQITIVEK
jgi:hypothetical protein